MKQFLFSRRSRSLSVCGAFAAVMAALAVSPALAAAAPPTQVTPAVPVAPAAPANATSYSEAGLYWGDTSSCSAPDLYQPFQSWRDNSYYMLAPGQDANGFNGQGWTFENGASVEAAPLQDGSTGNVLNMPSGSVAISPEICVSSDYPKARTMVRDILGAEGVQVYVAYAGTKTEDQPQNTGQVHGQQSDWTLSDPFNVQPGKAPGWQLMRFTLVAGGKTSDFQVYDFYVDPKWMA